jgi:hypothetical protein
MVERQGSLHKNMGGEVRTNGEEKNFEEVMEGGVPASPSPGEKEWRRWSFLVDKNGERHGGGALIAAVVEGLEEY